MATPDPDRNPKSISNCNHNTLQKRHNVPVLNGCDQPVLQLIKTYPINQSIRYSGSFSRMRQYSSEGSCRDDRTAGEYTRTTNTVQLSPTQNSKQKQRRLLKKHLPAPSSRTKHQYRLVLDTPLRYFLILNHRIVGHILWDWDTAYRGRSSFLMPMSDGPSFTPSFSCVKLVQ